MCGGERDGIRKISLCPKGGQGASRERGRVGGREGEGEGEYEYWLVRLV